MAVTVETLEKLERRITLTLAAADINSEVETRLKKLARTVKADGFRPGAYSEWQTIQLAPQTGAVCGNGSPYKFFVNRVAGTRNTIVYMEGGGACWDYASCTGQTGVRGARNPNGIPDDYMSLLNPGASLVSPFVTRISPFDAVKTQNWNMVYVPYCTGDIYSGDKVAIYPDPSGTNPPLVWHHNGVRNVRAVISWLKDNLPRPTQMLSTGCSAGGAGSLTSYAALRRDLAPDRGFLLDDSGPVCRCGQRGCLEAVAAGPAIARAWPKGAAGSAATALFAAAAGGDPAAEKVAGRIAGHLTTALIWLSATHDAEMIVLAGGVADAGEPFLSAVREQVARRGAASELAARRLRPEQVTLARVDDSPGARGAAVLAARLINTRESPATARKDT